MSRALTDGEVKALFRQLVKAAGGVEASAIELGCTHQRISNLQSVDKADVPSFRQIMALEAVVGRAIITGAAMRAIQGEIDDCLKEAMVDTVRASAEALSAVHVMDADGTRTAAEIRDVQQKTQTALKTAQGAADIAAGMTPGAVH